MKKIIVGVLLALASTDPAQATSGFVCRTAGARPIEVSMVIGHVYGSPLASAQLRDNGRNVPVAKAQWWVDRAELRLVLTNPSSTAEELILRARRSGRTYDGSLWRRGQRYWVRCREG